MGDRSHAKVHADIERMLSEPVTELVMKADGIELHDTKIMLARVSLAHYPAMPEGLRVHARYRQGVGIALFNKSGQVFVGQRSDMNSPAWQLPQGGIDPGETILEAAFRELREEIGTENADLAFASDDWLRYDLPADLQGHTWGGQWCGQEQCWIAMRFLGEDSEIDVNTAHPEFSKWRWVDLAEIPSLAAPFKQAVYEEVARRFAFLAGSAGEETSSTASPPA